MELIRQTKGRVLYASLDEIWLARGDALFVSKDKGQDFHFVCRLPVTSKKQYFSKSSLLRRLLRIGIKHLLPLGDEKFLLQGNRCISIWDQKKNIFLHHHQLHVSNPLAICQDNQGFLYYGEYFSNPNRQPVKVWRSVNQGKTWSPIYQFEHIRHIHGIYFDAI